MIFISCKDC